MVTIFMVLSYNTSHFERQEFTRFVRWMPNSAKWLSTPRPSHPTCALSPPASNYCLHPTSPQGRRPEDRDNASNWLEITAIVIYTRNELKYHTHGQHWRKTGKQKCVKYTTETSYGSLVQMKFWRNQTKLKEYKTPGYLDEMIIEWIPRNHN